MNRVRVLALLALTATACKTEEPPPQSSTPATSEVAKIVFVEQRDACDCTKKRIADSWAVLESALTGRQDVPVERLDTNDEKAARYQEIRAVMVIPAVYFLDSSGAIIELLQGELNEEQVTRLL